MSAEEALAPTRRHQHILPDGRVAYEWSQSLSDVTVFVPCPEGVRGRHLDVCIERKRCRLGLKGNPPYLDVSCALSYLRESSREKRKRRASEGKTAKRPWKNLSFPSFRRAMEIIKKRQNRSRLSFSLSSPPLHQNCSTRLLASSRLQSRSGRLVRWPIGLMKECVLFFGFFRRASSCSFRFEKFIALPLPPHLSLAPSLLHHHHNTEPQLAQRTASSTCT